MEKVAMTANATKRWYVVHAYSGFEKSVQRTLLDRIQRAGMKETFGKIRVPTPDVVELKRRVKNILQQMQEGVEKPKPKVLFEIGEAVRVREGPFTDFHGTVEDVNYDKSKLRVSVTIFGRATPVELEFGQVEKA